MNINYDYFHHLRIIHFTAVEKSVENVKNPVIIRICYILFTLYIHFLLVVIQNYVNRAHNL